MAARNTNSKTVPVIDPIHFLGPRTTHSFLPHGPFYTWGNDGALGDKPYSHNPFRSIATGKTDSHDRGHFPRFTTYEPRQLLVRGQAGVIATRPHKLRNLHSFSSRTDDD
jgi:hypothetical protein